jgi:glycerophosphoryl diester phosphodiesterase
VRVVPAVPPVIGHRGAAGSAPENTLASLRRAKALGCAWVEFDVRMTGDGELILLHDSRLDRTTDGKGRAAAQDLARIRRHDAGAWFAPEFSGERVPTLAETLAVLGEEGLGANVEIKPDRRRARETGAAVAAAISRDWPRHLPAPLLSSFDRRALAAAAETAPDIARGVLFRALPRGWHRIARRLGAATINADHRRLSPVQIAEIRAAGYPLLAYTVNDPVRARHLFDRGVSAVFSDMPQAILAALAAAAPRQAAAASVNSG